MSEASNALKKKEAEEMMKATTSKFDGLRVMKSEEIKRLLNDPNEEILLVDVRDKEEQEVSMIPTAITQKEFQYRKSGLSKKTLIVPYCTIGYRSGAFGKSLLEEGFENVHNGEGIVLWSHLENAELRTGIDRTESTNKVHTFGSTWDKVPDHIDSVQFGYFSLIAAFVYFLLGW